MKLSFVSKRILTGIFIFQYAFTFAQSNHAFEVNSAAISIINPRIIYDPSYCSINYPNGDVAPLKGVCTDVVIRAYRKLHVDLQQLVYEDMTKNFKYYARINKNARPDKNISHRRVPNLMVYFQRYGKVLPISTQNLDYHAGDIVCWEISPGINHIGIVTQLKNKETRNFMVVHNIGRGQVLEDCLFRFKQIGHYSY